MRKVLSASLLAASLAALGLCGYLIVVGLPQPEWLSFVKLKDIRKPFQAFLVFFLLSVIIHPKANEKVDRLARVLSHPAAIWVLLGFYTLLFLWHEVAEYLAIEINFIPFGFYDYMLPYFFQGKWHFTGLLHGFYHINNVMLLLAPVWYFFQSPLVLVTAYPLILVSAGIPLYYLGRLFFRESHVPLILVFVYLNFRYLQNLLDMNFVVEGFYPLFIFSLVYFAFRWKWFWYGVFLVLTLSVKEDAPFYLAAFGFILLFMRGKRLAGLATIAVSAAYFYFVHSLLVVWTGSDIFHGDFENFAKYGVTPFEITGYFALHIPEMTREFLGSKEAVKTLVKAFGHLAFLPFFSPFAIAGLAALFPLFIRGGESFVGLRFQYAAPFIGFLFPALVDGFHRLANLFSKRPGLREAVISLFLILLVFLNGGNFRVPRIEAEDLKTIALARSIPKEAVLVTHGHLLPYIGYREYNFYFQPPLEERDHPVKPVYDHADYYLLARGVNLFPMKEDFFESKLAQLRVRSDYELVHDDGVRYLFRKK